MASDIDGYVADSRYPSKFHQPIQPPWIDAALALNGLAAPRSSDEPFTLVDLGCGDGIGLILSAASHPRGRFIGLDAMPEHVERGTALIAALGLDNITLHCANFSSAHALADGSAHYVTAHGVLAWISETNRAALIALAARWLRPGGSFAVSYNAYPGWTPIAPFQAMIKAAALGLDGNSSERFASAFAMLRRQDLIAEPVWQWLEALGDQVGETYFAHEYLNAHWRPCWSGDVIGALAEHGLGYVGQLTSGRLRDDLCLTPQWRETIALMPSVPARQIAADLLSNCWFRRDLYLKLPALAYDSATELMTARMAQWWGQSSGLPADPAMHVQTTAGELSFDNAAVRAIRARLAHGPARLADVAQASAISAADLINSCDALWIADQVVPLGPPGDAARAASTNQGLRDAGIVINGSATEFGARST